MRALLLAGGGGTRLWPLSTEENPKQFLPLLSDRSLLAETYDRLVPWTREIFVATSARHAGRVRAELPDVPLVYDLIAKPEDRQLVELFTASTAILRPLAAPRKSSPLPNRRRLSTFRARSPTGQ